MPKLGPSIRNVRDLANRKAFASHEVLRRAYLYIARNTSLAPQVRYQAQLQLNSFKKDEGGRGMSIVKKRCVVTGKGRGVIGEFGMCRFQFKHAVDVGLLPGVKKASW